MSEPHLADHPHWRAMQVADLPQVYSIAAQVHPAYPEQPQVFAERLRLYPKGCWVWQQAGQLVGYLISHPWHKMQPPALDSLLHALPRMATVTSIKAGTENASTYYLHDIALLPQARGQQATPRILPTLAQLAHAHGLDNISLVAVNQSLSFWQAQGFKPVPMCDPENTSQDLAAKLQSYGPETHYLQCALSQITTI
ncbi:GNAT family N-acetyltransferase [Methylobacillus glycogenes]|uniref:GNAT family N-acetyltransferase n=1 Tax=Methylobacillus glycogenes TaxID=406 RepID=UPI0004701CC1|nr:GNAT family N-acetyltransferase [Methylobacillus glycogenes]